ETTHPVAVDVIGDALDEPNETVKVVLSNPVNAVIGAGTGSGTITDDDPKPSVAVADVSVVEGNSGAKNMTFTVKLSAATGRQINVDFATHDGTATVAGNDYIAKSGTLVFAP